MVVVRGLSLEEVLRRSATVDAVVERELHAVARQVAGQLGQVVVAAQVGQAASPNDVNLIRTLWRELVDKSLLAHVADALFAASRAVSLDFNRILDKVLREQPAWRPPDTRGTDGRRQAPPQRAGQRVYQPPPPTPSETDGNVDLDLPDDSDDFYLDPLDEDQATEAILNNSRNRLVDIGDEFWEHARDELVLGINEGESVDKLAARVRDAADVTLPRARTIARTEVIGACNAGSMLTMRSVDLVTTKVWLATPDTRTRLDHRLAQGQTVPLDEPFIVGGVPLDHPGDPAGPPGQVINCLVGETKVDWAGQDVLASTRRRYSGTFVQLVTARGHVLTVTPNHPVLTTRGYVPAGTLAPGDQVVATSGPDGPDPEVADAPPRVDEFHSALRETGKVSRVVGSRVNFHGDGTDDEVEVVRTNSNLLLKLDVQLFTDSGEPQLVRLDHGESALASVGGAEAALCNSDYRLTWRVDSASSVGSDSQTATLVETESLHAQAVSLTATPSLQSELSKSPVDQRPADAEFLRHTKHALTLGMSPCEVTEVNRLTDTHYVYNLSTSDEWYTANGIACHNCRCTQVFDVEELPTPEGEEDSDDIEGFDPSMFPDVDFNTLGLRALHLPGKHNQADHANKKKKKGGSDSKGGDSDSDSDSGGGASGGPEQRQGVEPRNPPAEPLTGTDYRDLLDRYEENYDAVGVDLSRASSALDSYVGNDYANINGGMRRGSVDSQSQDTIDALNEVFDSGVLTTDPFVTYRGLGNTPWTFGKTPEPGDVFTDRAFGSTTANRKTADTFLDGAGGTTGLSFKRIVEIDPGALDSAAVLSINVPSGSRVIPVDSLRGAGSGSGFSRESEILLPPDTSLRVVSVDEPDADTATPRVIHVEVVTDG